MNEHPDCDAMQLLLQADHDGELDPAQAAAAAAHAESCASCARWRTELAELSAELRASVPVHVAPPGLADRLGLNAPPVRRRPAPRWRWKWATPQGGAGFLAGLAVAATAAFLVMPRTAPEDPASALLAAHIRALQPGHLLDVPSTDQHTVKPWFDGRLDYAPPVRDFAAEGFPLVGGRLDYLDGRPVAALVYRRAQHVIDLFVWPDRDPAAAAITPTLTTLRGYAILSWARDGMRFRAVSDVSAAELAHFAALWGG